MVFYALEATHPQKFHCSSRIPFPSTVSSKTRGQEFGRGHARFAFWSMCIQLTYLG